MAEQFKPLRTIKEDKLDCSDHYFAPTKSFRGPFDQNVHIVCCNNFKLVMEKDENIPTLEELQTSNSCD
jgi:hypothetical protein